MSLGERRKIVSKDVDLSLSRQCKVLNISRSGLYYTPVGMCGQTLALMHQIDRVFTRFPFFGSRQSTAYLPRTGYRAGRHRVRRLMKIMGLEAIYKRPNTSKTSLKPDISLSAARPADRSGQPGLVFRHHLSANAPRVFISGSDHGLAYPQGAQLADNKHA